MIESLLGLHHPYNQSIQQNHQLCLGFGMKSTKWQIDGSHFFPNLIQCMLFN